MSDDSHVKRGTLLVIDDDLGVRESLKLIFGTKFDIVEATNGEEGLTRYSERPYTVVLLDLLMPGLDGIETLRKIREVDADAQVIMITALHAVDTAVAAMKAGAADYVTKPFEVERLRTMVGRLAEKAALRAENRFLKAEIARTAGGAVGLEALIGSSEAMRTLRQRIEQVAQAEAGALISGETGTGKELVARAIHRCGPRVGKHFVPINCAAVPESLFESELFGHEKGAFTSAEKQRVGFFEHADGGVLFLDEVSSTPPALQPKLLRALETGEFFRVGSSRPIRVNTQVLAASNADLRIMINDHRFREDLYFRLRVVEIRVPALRDRIEDLPELVKHFLDRTRASRGQGPHGFTQEALDVLAHYRWPGNVRELRNFIEMLAVVTKHDVIGAEDLPIEYFVVPTDGDPGSIEQGLRNALSVFERRYIMKALERADGNRTRAAEALGIHRNVLLRRMEELKIS